MKASKGSSFEREICKTLSKWWTQDLDEPRDDIFWRTSQSGGRATTRAKQNISTANSYGDVGWIDPIGQSFLDNCLLELKRGYTHEISILDFIDKAKGVPILIQWWDKATGERHLAGRKYTVLIFRRDRHKSCIMISGNMFSDLQNWFGDFPKDRIEINTYKYNLIIIDFEIFLSWCHPDYFRQKNSK